MTTHHLKTVNPHFRSTWYGHKSFEIRLNDRGFNVNDTLVLQEFDPKEAEYSGREITVKVDHMLMGHVYPDLGLSPEHVIMSTTMMHRKDV